MTFVEVKMADSDAEEVRFSVKVMINKEKTKVLFAESDCHFVDVLLSFLTLPLGKIVKLLDKHYGDEAPTIGCLNTFYNSVANLDSSHFYTEGAKRILLNPTSEFDITRRKLKLDISDSQPEFFYCKEHPTNRFWRVSMYYDEATSCKHSGRFTKSFWSCEMKKALAAKLSQAARSGGVFTKDMTAFIITDDLKIIPDAIGFVHTFSMLDNDITGTDNAELMMSLLGSIMNLLKASMISKTPLSDLLLNKAKLNKTKQMNSFKVESESEPSLNQIERGENPNFKKMMLKVTVQKSTNKLLFAQAKKDFIEFLFSVLTIPLGGVECLLSSRTCLKGIDNLYKSVSDLIDDECFKTSHIKNRLINPKLPHGYTSKNMILPLTEKSLPDSYKPISLFSSVNFPQGQGNYIKGSRTYQVLDDLTVKPFYISSILCSLNQQMIPASDVKELEIEVGLKEALSILKASLTSSSALTNGLLNHISKRQPKQET